MKKQLNTIPPEQLALLRCHHCEGRLKDEEEVYTIAARKFSKYQVDFSRLKSTHADEFFNIPVYREINFHKECFIAIAGEQYAT